MPMDTWVYIAIVTFYQFNPLQPQLKGEAYFRELHASMCDYIIARVSLLDCMHACGEKNVALRLDVIELNDL